MNADLTRTAAECAAFFHEHGFFIYNNAISHAEIDELIQAVDSLPEREEVRRKRSVYGVRNLLEICPRVQELSRQSCLRTFVTAAIGPQAFAVRAIFFDKVPDANWSLFWHQDNVLAVKQRVEVPGYTGWSQKAGVWQVQPPVEVLSKMITIRVHLDDCGPENGPLRVLPGSHRHGWLDDTLDEWKVRVPEVVCSVKKGGLVAMSPLTLHASAASNVVAHRRVIHIEYAAQDLPDGLEWNNRIGADIPVP